jgi:glutamyl-Q tRNA(Asp) synthetase
MTAAPDQPIFRFAPSPNGRLHLGHAYSALLNARMSTEMNGEYLLRIEDADASRSRSEFETAISNDLAWLGLHFPAPARRQSEHVDDYARALASLESRALVYPCFCTRSEVERASEGLRDPDGAPLHRGACAIASAAENATRQSAGARPAIRVNMKRAVSIAPRLAWREYGEGLREEIVDADPAVWGDVVLQGKQLPASYHLAVVVDDAIQGVTDVVRGADLYHATSIHRLLQALLGIEAPRYRHHRLVRDASGAKMSKSAQSQPLSILRDQGFGAQEIRAALGFEAIASSRLIATIR